MKGGGDNNTTVVDRSNSNVLLHWRINILNCGVGYFPNSLISCWLFACGEFVFLNLVNATTIHTLLARQQNKNINWLLWSWNCMGRWERLVSQVESSQASERARVSYRVRCVVNTGSWVSLRIFFVSALVHWNALANDNILLQQQQVIITRSTKN